MIIIIRLEHCPDRVPFDGRLLARCLVEPILNGPCQLLLPLQLHRRVAERYFPHDAVVAYAENVEVLRGDKYV